MRVSGEVEVVVAAEVEMAAALAVAAMAIAVVETVAMVASDGGTEVKRGGKRAVHW